MIQQSIINPQIPVITPLLKSHDMFFRPVKSFYCSYGTAYVLPAVPITYLQISTGSIETQCHFTETVVLTTPVFNCLMLRFHIRHIASCSSKINICPISVRRGVSKANSLFFQIHRCHIHYRTRSSLRLIYGNGVSTFCISGYLNYIAVVYSPIRHCSITCCFSNCYPILCLSRCLQGTYHSCYEGKCRATLCKLFTFHSKSSFSNRRQNTLSAFSF